MWEAMDQTAKPLISYPDTFPAKLYRYRPVSPKILDRLIDFEILEEGIYFAGLKDLNDPDEGRFLVSFQGTRDEIASYWREAFKSGEANMSANEAERLAYERADEIIAAGGRVPKHVVDYTRLVIEHVLRVACFTTLPTNYSMWANYAKYSNGADVSIDHGGICIEYACDESWRDVNLHPVLYSDEVPKINPVARDAARFVKAAYFKSSEWRCEDEWRIFMIIQSMPPFPANLTLNSRIRNEGGVSGVIFGSKTPDEVVAEITKRIDQAGREVSLKRVVRDPTTYERVLRDVA